MTLDELKKGLTETGSTNPILASMFVGKTPTEIDEILSKLTPEAINRLQLLVAKLDPTANLIASATAQSPQAVRTESEFEKAIAIIKLMKEMQPPAPAPAPAQQQITVTDIVKIIEMVNSNKGGGQMSSFDALQKAADIYKPFLEAGSQKDKEIFNLRMKELENKLPQDPIETIKYVKEVAKDLGLSSGQRTEVDLRLEQMKQDREVDMKRLDWEQRKYEMEQDADVAKWEQIGKILQGPIGQAIQGIGNAGADRVRGGNSGAPRKTGRQPTAVQTQCPNCQHVIYVDAEADTAICGQCGAILQKQGVPTPQSAQQPQPPPQPEPTHVEEQPNPAPAQENQEEEEEEKESGPNETEGNEGTESS